LIRAILQGRRARMPAFAKGLDDSDIALIAAYLRQSRTSSAPWPHLDQDVARIRAEDDAQASRAP
jgi:mono/diheme cytochrome c family protein